MARCSLAARERIAAVFSVSVAVDEDEESAAASPRWTNESF